MAHQTAASEGIESIHAEDFHPRTIGDDPVLLEQSYRLRYQVYCVERQFLRAGDYPNQLETDEFDGDSVHVGAVDLSGELAATARIVKPNGRGFPMFRHCALFPDVPTLSQPGTVPVEVSRVSISRNYVRRERRRRTEPFLTLLNAVIRAAKRAGATHLIGATDAALHRWLVHFGFPYRFVGPEVDYYGLVAPCIMSLHELDEIILGGQYASLDGFPVGWDPSLWPGENAYTVTSSASVASAATGGWQPIHP